MTGTAGGFSFDRSLPPQTGFAAYPRDEAVLTRARSAWAPQFNDLHKFFEAQYDGVDAARVPGIAGYRPPTPEGLNAVSPAEARSRKLAACYPRITRSAR